MLASMFLSEGESTHLMETPRPKNMLCAGVPPGLEGSLPRQVPPQTLCLTSLPRPTSATWDLSEPVKLARTVGGGLVLASVHGVPLMAAPSALKATCVSQGDSQSTASRSGDGAESTSSTKEEEEELEAEADMVGCQKRKRSRFCKAKRDLYRRLVEQLVSLARDSPDSFSLDAVRLPRSISSSQEAREKLLATVMRFAVAEA